MRQKKVARYYAYTHTRGRWRVKLLPIWNIALEGGGWSGPRCSRLTPKQTQFHCTGGWLVLGAGLDGTERFTPPGFDPQPAQPVASRYTD